MPRCAVTGSSCPTASSRARRRPHPRVAPTSRRWRPPPTSLGRTGRRSLTRHAPRLRPSSGKRRRKGRDRCTTSHTTSPRSSATTVASCSSTARAPPGPSPLARTRSPPPTASLGTSSFVLAGEPGSLERSFGSTCHGAGRTLSRTGARKQIHGADLRRQLGAEGIVVRSPSNKGLAEEAPFAYKHVERVVEVVERAGLARRVAQLVPLGVVKG